MTAQELKSIKFEKSAFGYRPDDVDAFIDRMAASLREHEQKQADMEKKVYILAEKIEEYRSEEDSLKAALLGAQKMGDSIVKEAKVKAKQIEEDAEVKAEQVLRASQEELDRTKYELARMKREVSSFKSKLLSLYKSHLEMIGLLPDAPQEKPEETDKESEQPIQGQDAVQTTQQQGSSEPVEEESAPDSNEQQSSDRTTGWRSSKFGPLQFGDNYHGEEE